MARIANSNFTVPTARQTPATVLQQNTAARPPATGVTSTTATQTAVQPTTVMPTTQGGGFMPTTIAGFNPQQVQAFDRLVGQESSNPIMDWAGSALPRMFDTYAPKAGSAYDAVMEYSKKLGAEPNRYDVSTMVDPYMNPYIEKFINPTIDRLKRERDIRESNIKSQASRVGAFGDTTDAVQRSLNEGEYDRNTAEFLGNAYKGAYDTALQSSMGQFNTEEDRRMNGLSGAISGFSGAGQGYQGIINSLPNVTRTAYGMGADNQSREREIASDILGVGDRRQQLEQQKLNEVERLRSGLSNYDWEQLKKVMEVTNAYPKTGSTTTTPGASTTDILGSLGGAVSGSWDKWFPKQTPNQVPWLNPDTGRYV